MKSKKSKLPKRKPGKRSPEESKKYDAELRKLYNEGGITYSHAAELTGCSRQYAADKFHKFDEELADEGIAASWIEKNNAAKTRAKEGFSRDIKKCDNRIEDLQSRLTQAKEKQKLLEVKVLNDVLESELGEFLGQVDMKTVYAILNKIVDTTNLWKNMGYYVETISNNLRSEIILQNELKQQFEIIDLMPPASEILDREIEKRIAAKMNLTEQTEAKVQQEMKKKK